MAKSNYVKRTQKDYSLSLKLQVVHLIERGELSTTKLNVNMEYKPEVPL